MILATMKAMSEAKARGWVTLEDLCQEMGIGKSRTRLKLRESGIATNDGVYAWPRDSAELQRVRVMLLGDRAGDGLIG
jgi:hypothetical protein